MPLLTLQSREVKLIFGQISAKYQASSLTFWRKWANFCHFLLYNEKKSNWFLVKFWQNTKPIALLFGENGLIFVTFYSTIKRRQIGFWWNFSKIPSLGPYFLAKIGPFMPLFTLQSKEVSLIFGEISAKHQAYSLSFWRKWANFCHFSLYNRKKSNWFLVKFRQNTKPIALPSGENGPNFTTFHSTIKWSQMDFWWNFGKIPSL